MHQNNMIFCIIGILMILVLSMSYIFAIVVFAISFNDVAVVYDKGNAYRILSWYMSKDDAINIVNNSNLVDKEGVFYHVIS